MTIESQRGFSLTEVVVATLILAFALVPALDSLTTSTRGEEIHASEAKLHFGLLEKLEQVLAEDYRSLDEEAQSLGGKATPSGVYSDAEGAAYRRRVYLSRYDADNIDGDNDPFTGVDEGLLWIRVDIEHTGHALETLVSAYE